MTNVPTSDVLRQRLARLDSEGRLRSARQVESLPNARCRIDGRELVNFGANDYLNLAHDSRVCDAFAGVANRQVGSTASSLIVGRSKYHAQLEDALARFEQCEAALLFPTGFAANLGTIQALAGRQDALFCDRDNHASLIDAARGTKAHIHVYEHQHRDCLSRELRRQRSEFEQVFLVTDGVFSMDGCIAPLDELCALAEQQSAAVIVDEAHGTGVLGEYGRGASEVTGVESRTLVRVGTLSKALGGLGGFAVGSRDTIEWLRNTARPQFFSTALPPAMCAAMLESLRIVQDEPERRIILRNLNRHARDTARSFNLDVLGNGPAPIIPIVIPEESDVVHVSNQLQEQGWFVPAIRPPTVPPGTCRLRMSVSVAHSEDEIKALLEAIVGLVPRPSQGT